MKKKTILILLCGWFAIMVTRAQCAAQNEAIQAGEELVYDLKFNWKFIWVAAGQAKMDMQAITYQGKPCFRSNLISVGSTVIRWTKYGSAMKMENVLPISVV